MLSPPSWLTFLSSCVSQTPFILAHRHLTPHQTAAASLARAPTHPHSRTPRRNPPMVAIGQSRSLRTRTAVSRHTVAPSHGSNSPIRILRQSGPLPLLRSTAPASQRISTPPRCTWQAGSRSALPRCSRQMCNRTTSRPRSRRARPG